MPLVTPDQFWEKYSCECRKIINNYKFYCEISRAEYTALQIKILEEVGKNLDYGKKNIYREIYREFLTVDMGYFNFPNYSNKTNNYKNDDYYDWDWLLL
jgi:uncharacterized protein YjaG (DUF416 family)